MRPCHKIGQGQPRVIIWTNYDEQGTLHTKLLGNRSTGSGEEEFWSVFTIYGRGGHLGLVTQMPRKNFRSPYTRRLHIKLGFDWPSGFREEDVWKCERTDDGRRTPERGYTKSSPVSLPKNLCWPWPILRYGQVYNLGFYVSWCNNDGFL